MTPVPAMLRHALAAAAPRLDGAACLGMWEAFDPADTGETEQDVDYRHRTAMGICARCPALSACRTWVDSLPPRQRPGGVTAGRINPTPSEKGIPA